MQPTLFDDIEPEPPPAPRSVSPRTMARSTDPETSHQAARQVTASGSAQAQRDRVLSVVRAKPGLTSDEIAAELAESRHMPARRLPELERLKLVRRGEARASRVGGRSGITWFPVEAKS